MADRRTTKKKAKKRAKRMSEQRTIKIEAGVVVDGDRHVEVKRKHKVKWQNLSPTDCQVVFGPLTDPFAPGKVIDVPGSGESEEEVIRGLPGTYKYSVLAAGSVKDDPNIIIRS